MSTGGCKTCKKPAIAGALATNASQNISAGGTGRVVSPIQSNKKSTLAVVQPLSKKVRHEISPKNLMTTIPQSPTVVSTSCEFNINLPPWTIEKTLPDTTCVNVIDGVNQATNVPFTITVTQSQQQPQLCWSLNWLFRNPTSAPLLINTVTTQVDLNSNGNESIFATSECSSSPVVPLLVAAGGSASGICSGCAPFNCPPSGQIADVYTLFVSLQVTNPDGTNPVVYSSNDSNIPIGCQCPPFDVSSTDCEQCYCLYDSNQINITTITGASSSGPNNLPGLVGITVDALVPISQICTGDFTDSTGATPIVISGNIGLGSECGATFSNTAYLVNSSPTQVPPCASTFDPSTTTSCYIFSTAQTEVSCVDVAVSMVATNECEENICICKTSTVTNPSVSDCNFNSNSQATIDYQVSFKESQEQNCNICANFTLTACPGCYPYTLLMTIGSFGFVLNSPVEISGTFVNPPVPVSGGPCPGFTADGSSCDTTQFGCASGTICIAQGSTSNCWQVCYNATELEDFIDQVSGLLGVSPPAATISVRIIFPPNVAVLSNESPIDFTSQVTELCVNDCITTSPITSGCPALGPANLSISLDTSYYTNFDFVPPLVPPFSASDLTLLQNLLDALDPLNTCQNYTFSSSADDQRLLTILLAAGFHDTVGFTPTLANCGCCYKVNDLFSATSGAGGCEAAGNVQCGSPGVSTSIGQTIDVIQFCPCPIPAPSQLSLPSALAATKMTAQKVGKSAVSQQKFAILPQFRRDSVTNRQRAVPILASNIQKGPVNKSKTTFAALKK